MKVGYAILYDDGTLTISKKHTILQKPIYKDYGEFDDNKIPWAWGKDDNCFIRKLHEIQLVSSGMDFKNC